jgi:hypothetical protein
MAEHSLDDLVKSIQSAVLAATDIAERHELDALQREEFWERQLDDDGNPVVQDGKNVYVPRMAVMRVPVWDGGKLINKDIPVPLQTLTTGQSLRVDELTVRMSVQVQGLLDSGDKHDLMIRPAQGGSWFRKTPNTAKLEIKFKGSDPPEGYARLDDQLIKLLP